VGRSDQWTNLSSANGRDSRDAKKVQTNEKYYMVRGYERRSEATKKGRSLSVRRMETK